MKKGDELPQHLKIELLTEKIHAGLCCFIFTLSKNYIVHHDYLSRVEKTIHCLNNIEIDHHNLILQD